MTHVLTASVGDQPGDFAWTVPGEMVYLGFVCDRDLMEGRDRGCGCGRSFSGLTSRKATTVAVVADLDLTRDDIIRDGITQGGWSTEYADEAADITLTIAAEYPIGTRLRRWLDDVEPDDQ
jgi:hypothetical protein